MNIDICWIRKIVFFINNFLPNRFGFENYNILLRNTSYIDSDHVLLYKNTCNFKVRMSHLL